MHPIKRVFLIGLFSLGTIAGFGHGIAHLGSCASSCHADRRAAFEDRVADVCTRSAERVWQERSAASATTAPAAVAAPGATFTITAPATLTLGAPAPAAAAVPAPVAALPSIAPAADAPATP